MSYDLKDLSEAIEHLYGKEGLDAAIAFARLANRCRESKKRVDEQNAQLPAWPGAPLSQKEFIDRIARAVWSVRREMAAKVNVDLEDWGDGTIPHANHLYEEVIAALTAMRQPTASMVAAGDKCTDWASGADDAWEAMIDVALRCALPSQESGEP